MLPEYNPETGEAMASQPLPSESSPPPPSALSSSVKPPHQMVGRGLMQAFSLHPAPAVFAIGVDSMISTIDVATVGISAPVLWLIGSIATFAVVFMAQKKWGGDDSESALLKAGMVSFLVALPTPFPAFLTVPSAVVGFVRSLSRRKGLKP
jgi:hypothetical protein